MVLLFGGASWRRFAGFALVACIITVLAPIGFAQSRETGTVAGRVYNEATKSYLPGAEIHIDGTAASAITDNTGSFEITGVPTGPAKVAITFAGLDPAVQDVVVAAGKRVSFEVGLKSADYSDKLLQLDTFIVAGEREGKAASVSQQKAADNIVNVISSDEFPNVAGGSVGDFLRNVPGITIDYSVADPRAIRVRGMDPNMNAVTVNGMRAANAASSNTNRTFEIDQISMQDVEAVEVYKSALPSMDADSGGGAVNLISKSAFKLKGRRVSYSALLFANSDDLSLSKTSGPDDHHILKLRPGGTFAYSEAFFNNRLGVSISANFNEFYTPQPSNSINWLMTAANGLPGTSVSSPQGAFPRQLLYSSSPIITRRKALAVNLDYKLSDSTELWLRSQVNTSLIYGGARGIDLNDNTNPSTTGFTTNGPAANWSVNSVTNYGDGTATQAQAFASASNTFAHIGGEYLDKFGVGTTFSFGTKSRWANWKLDTAFSTSLSTNHYSNFQGMPVPQVDLYLRGISWRYDMPDGSNYPTFTQLSGPDIFDLSNYVSKAATGATSNVPGTNVTSNGVAYPRVMIDNPQFAPFQLRNGRRAASMELFRTAKFDLSHDIVWRVPFTLQTGATIRQQVRDIDRNGQTRWLYVGPDGVAGTNDDYTSLNLAQFATTDFTPNFGPYKSVPTYNLEKINQFFIMNPSLFKEDVAFRIETEGANLRHLSETVAGGYGMATIKITPKLSLLGGLRYETTTDEGSGPAADNRAARDAAIADLLAYVQSKGYATIAAAPSTVTGAFRADAAKLARIRYANRVHAKHEFDDLFPNVQLKYSITRRLIARAAYTETIGRQNFAYIMPGYTVTSATATAFDIVEINNPALKPVYFHNYDVSLEYYMPSSGLISVGAFRKAIKNYTVNVDETIAAGVDYEYDLSGFIGGTLRRRINAGTATMKGIEVKYSQPLGNLSPWLRPFSAFAGFTYQKSEATASYGGTSSLGVNQPVPNVIPKLVNLGLTYRRNPVTCSLVYNWRDTYANTVTTTSSTSDLFVRYTEKRGTLDVSLAYAFYKNNSFFIDAKNVVNTPRRDFVIRDGITRSYNIDGIWIYFGVKGAF